CARHAALVARQPQRRFAAHPGRPEPGRIGVRSDRAPAAFARLLHLARGHRFRPSAVFSDPRLCAAALAAGRRCNDVADPWLGRGVAVPAALGGDRLAIGALFLACGLHQWRAGLRVRIARSVGGERRGAARLLLFDRWAAPAWLLFHAAIIWSTLFLRTINWG